MIMKNKKTHCLCAVILCVIMICGCCACRENNLQPLDVNTICVDDEIAFGFTAEDFIQRFNCVSQEYGLSLEIKSASTCWQHLEYDSSPFCDTTHICRVYNDDPEVLTHPTVSFYVPDDGSAVYALTVDFDDHGYSRELYEIYTEQCFCVLKVIMPECSDEEISGAVDELNRIANENMFLERLSADTVPLLIYHNGRVGVFSYFAQGDYIHICIVPVTAEYLEQMETQGAELRRTGRKEG